ncbi:Uncharacterized protein PITC_058250 [Penicillium italicum]|uniref:BTB domain-containing protein n=1 Tax=Penicillium italicum TaxID=40296 RepID=A0A0A2LEW6_PENIT|nr:Uncharacterized protein PITC_058250 [Penicillium italicum]
MPKKRTIGSSFIQEPPKLISEPPGSPKEGIFQNTIPGQELLDALGSMRLDPKYSDFTIVCGDGEYAVHKCIVCTRSTFFAKACDGGFEESSTNTVVLQEEPVLVERMIDYLYSLDYQIEDCLLDSDHDSSEKPPVLCDYEGATTFTESYAQNAQSGMDDNSLGNTDEHLTPFDPLSFHILMYSLADRMFIEGLKALSKGKVERGLVQRLDANTFQSAIMEIYRKQSKSVGGDTSLGKYCTEKNLESKSDIFRGDLNVRK